MPAGRGPGERGPYKKTTARQQAAALLIDAGVKPKQALEQLGYSGKSVNSVTKRLRDKGLMEFATKKRVKSATKVIETFMEGKPVGRIEEKQDDGTTVVVEPGVMPKDSTVLAAANTVLDRAYPKAQEGSKGDTYNFINVDLSGYRADRQNPLQGRVVEVVPETTVGNGE